MEMRLEEEEEEREKTVNCLYTFVVRINFGSLGKKKNLIFMFIIYNDIVTNFLWRVIHTHKTLCCTIMTVYDLN